MKSGVEIYARGSSARRCVAAGPRSSAVALLALLAASTAAQQPAIPGECERGWGRGDRAHFCEIRELTLPASGSLTVGGGPNGGVQVTGWDRNEVLLRARVQAWADDEQEAAEIARQVQVRTDGTIRAEGPQRRGRASWAVSYEVFAPRATDLQLETDNGGVAIENVRGDIDFRVSNGGVRLEGVGGDVRGRTTNGGINATLTGGTWDGEGLDVETTNGGIRLQVPSDYSARLESGTVNGQIHIDFPVTVQGRVGREISTTLGEGGPLVRVRTVNGGVRISRD